ncbi:unnamed protein product [Adineta steineri]|uniref:Esterase n=1 Tax=Adineta steineri TaxID=433720 RepID=A0A816AGX3_9BILA|nr:unnamed protein product [Adineta steineri]
MDYTIGDAPHFVSAYGITFHSFAKINSQLYEVYLFTSEVRGMQKVRIIVPPAYATSGNSTYYPVLYLLHGAYGNADTWTTFAPGQIACGNESLITVMPNGDSFGFYTNWVNPGNDAPQNWRTYHMEQLVPWIDLNFRTVAKKQGRALIGFSMGGFGAIRYAQQYPHNFAYTVGLSCPLDMRDTHIQQTLYNFPFDGKPLVGPFGIPSQPIASNGWYAQDPITHAATLRDVNVALYAGDGDSLEILLRDSTIRMRNTLVSLNISVYFDDFGNGQFVGHGCTGKHDGTCMVGLLIKVLPRVMAVLKQ